MSIRFGIRTLSPWLILISLLSTGLPAAQQRPAETWNRADAFAAVRSVDVDRAVIDRAVAQIGGISSLADGGYTLGKLHELENRGDWPLPAREAALYRFTLSLAKLPRAAVAAAVMRHLRTYRARTLVSHEDHTDALVPLFNINAAATGVENAWLHREALADAGQALQTNPAQLLDMYVQSDHNAQRSAYLQALEQAQPAALQAITAATSKRLDDRPELSAILGTLVKVSGDTNALRQLLMRGRGAALAHALQTATTRVPPAILADMIKMAIQHAPTDNAALAIAQWWPLLRHDTPTRQLLLDKLADPALGSAALLALAQAPDGATIKALQDLAAADSMAAGRARTALDINRLLTTGQSQQ